MKIEFSSIEERKKTTKRTTKILSDIATKLGGNVTESTNDQNELLELIRDNITEGGSKLYKHQVTVRCCDDSDYEIYGPTYPHYISYDFVSSDNTPIDTYAKLYDIAPECKFIKTQYPYVDASGRGGDSPNSTYGALKMINGAIEISVDEYGDYYDFECNKYGNCVMLLYSRVGTNYDPDHGYDYYRECEITGMVYNPMSDNHGSYHKVFKVTSYNNVLVSDTVTEL